MNCSPKSGQNKKRGMESIVINFAILSLFLTHFA